MLPRSMRDSTHGPPSSPRRHGGNSAAATAPLEGLLDCVKRGNYVRFSPFYRRPERAFLRLLKRENMCIFGIFWTGPGGLEGLLDCVKRGNYVHVSPFLPPPREGFLRLLKRENYVYFCCICWAGPGGLEGLLDCVKRGNYVHCSPFVPPPREGFLRLLKRGNCVHVSHVLGWSGRFKTGLWGHRT